VSKKRVGLVLIILLFVLSIPTFVFAKTSEPSFHLSLNGIDVTETLDTFMGSDHHIYASVNDVAAFYSIKSIDTKGMTTKKVKGTVYAPITSLIKSFGDSNTIYHWNQTSKQFNGTVLPPGTIKLTPAVPQMGEHWSNPKDMPLGPIYGIYKGKLIFIEIMPAKDLDKTVHDLPANLVPAPVIDHFDIDWNPAGHEGFEVPHYDLHAYFISREEQNKIAVPTGTESVDPHAGMRM
jgi:hypothetical protein